MRISPCIFALPLGLALTLTGCRGMNIGNAQTGALVANGGTSQLPPSNSPVQRLIVVILQNNSFDHLFGTFPGAEGIAPGKPGYSEIDANGQTVTPFLLTNIAPAALPEGRTNYLKVIDNGAMDKFAYYNGDTAMGYYDASTPGISSLWSLAQQYALADHYFHSVIGEAPTNQLYMVAAADNNVLHPVQPDFGPCQQPDQYAQPYSFPNVGDELTARNIDWEFFQENYGLCGFFNPEHDPFQYFVSTNNTSHIQDYNQFTLQLQNGTLPAVSFVVPANGHDMHAGGGSIIGGTNFVQALVQQVQNSSAWANVAIVITFDTGGGWYDHVAPPQVDDQGLGFRVPLIVVSPFAKKGYISHLQMDHVSILKFIQWNWGLASLNPRNDQSTDIRDMFQF